MTQGGCTSGIITAPVRVGHGRLHKVSRPYTFRTVEVPFHSVTQKALRVMAVAVCGRHAEVPRSLAFSKIT